MSLDFDVIVIGAGPAGMTSAIYLKRSNINVVMIDGVAPGGQINRTAKIENYPGFTMIEGPTLAFNIFNQTQTLGIPYKYGKVIEIIDNKEYKIVKTDKEELTCKGIIIAIGRKPRELGLENEKKLIGRGVSWCAICDAPLFKGKDVAVIGGGNSALEESLQLAEYTNKVTLIHRYNDFKGDEILESKVKNNSKIEIIDNSNITKLNPVDNVLDSIEVENINNREKKIINVSGLFIYIGFEPNLDIVKNLNLDNEKGYIVVDSNMRTNIPGIYACGDIIKKELYQIVTAISEGAVAAISAVKDITENK